MCLAQGHKMVAPLRLYSAFYDALFIIFNGKPFMSEVCLGFYGALFHYHHPYR